MTRTLSHIASYPLAGDVIELRERMTDPDGDPFDGEVMLRVIAVAEELVWFKQYGKSRRLIVSLKEWKQRIETALSGTVIRGADYNCPF